MENDAIGTGASGRRLGAAILGLLHSHIELFGIELQEQKGRTLSLLLFAGLALVFALLLLTALSGLLLVLLWDSYRLAGIIGMCIFYGLAALYCGLRLRPQCSTSRRRSVPPSKNLPRTGSACCHEPA